MTLEELKQEAEYLVQLRDASESEDDYWYFDYKLLKVQALIDKLYPLSKS